MPVFDFSKVTPSSYLRVSERGPVIGAAIQRDIRKGLRSERDADIASGAHPKIAQQRGVILEVLKLVGTQFRIPLLHLNIFLRIEIAEKGNFRRASLFSADGGLELSRFVGREALFQLGLQVVQGRSLGLSGCGPPCSLLLSESANIWLG